MKHRDEGLRTVAARWLAGPALLVAWVLGGCSSPLHQAPSRPQAEAGQNQVQLTWGEVPDAESYNIAWAEGGAAGEPLPNEITGITATSYLHTGLTNFKTYRYRIYAVKGGKTSPGSVEVSAEPGPTPNSVEWATVTVSGSDHVIYFGTAAGATAYRIYYSTDPSVLTGRFPSANYATATASPYTRTGAATVVYYYRVMAMSSVRPALDGPLVVVPLFSLADTALPTVAPALGDPDADNCLDAVVAKGNCSGTLTAVTLTDAGLSGLTATGRVNGDSRIADFNGDGKADIFTSTSARADHAASRAILHLNQGSGKFAEDPGMAAKSIGGFSGTVLAADFNNDGSVDIFAPNDASQGDGGRNWLLVNSGSAVFVDRAQEAGLRSGPVGAEYVPHGGQAADINEDGRIDILVGSQLFINNGDGTFTDRAADYRLPVRADRGLRLVDVDMDGRLDLVQHDGQVLRLYRNVAGRFDAGTVVDGDGSGTSYGYGLAACDVNGDGFEDVVVANNSASTNTGTPHLLINVNGELRPSALPVKTTLTPNDLISCGDLDNNGRADIVAREGTVVSTMPGAGVALGSIRIRVLGASGLRNQQGRIVKIVPAAYPARTITRVIDGGSGLMSQGDYDVVVGTLWAGNYAVSVRFKDGWVNATTTPGSSLTIYEDGKISTKLD